MSNYQNGDCPKVCETSRNKCRGYTDCFRNNNHCIPSCPPVSSVRCQNCNVKLPYCSNLPQPISPPNPALSLDGENCLSCYLNRTLLTKPSDLNSVLISLTNP